MQRELLTGNGAAAWGARLARIEYLPAFPITPQTEIIENLSQWIDGGEMDCRMVTMDSEHSMITAAGAAAVTGVRTCTATSSQGLLHGMEMLYTVAGWRAPFVLINVSRGLAAPITLEPDHNDILAARDSSCVQLHCSTCQEVVDHMLIAFRLAESEGVRLPVIVNLDGFYLSFTREVVQLPDSRTADAFLPPYPSDFSLRFRPHEPVSAGVAVLGGSTYSYFRYQAHLASLHALPQYEKICLDFADLFGRQYGPLEEYQNKDAEYVFIMIGSYATKAKQAVDSLREAGWKIGLVRPRILRPYPEAHLCKALQGKKGVAVIDQNISMGKGGILYTELRSALYGHPDAPLLASFIGGLGGRDIKEEEFFEMASVLKQASADGTPPPPRLLYTEEEMREMRALQTIAGAIPVAQGDSR
ncbi:pyruvate synthase [Desulfogranum marinum]|uniref:pyruvate synthase n=1 Tax=Desulfogranum marinum TaxID=453220 RepID=UPI001966074E|nr:pyruvate synthase [Desulfogranum marinum]MBM9514922.1 pyruvate synthase [Desulfogranum marinum]